MTHHRLAVGIASSFAVLLTAVSPGRAVDGVIEISQVAIEDAGFPYAISGPGSYRLTSNLTVNGDVAAIRVDASNVTIDLNGFTIFGPGAETATNHGIDATTSFVTVRNGTVRGFRHGISGRVMRVEDVDVIANGDDGINVGVASMIRNVRARANNGDGVQIAGGIVADCMIADNGNGIHGPNDTVGLSNNVIDSDSGTTLIGPSLVNQGGNVCNGSTLACAPLLP